MRPHAHLHTTAMAFTATVLVTYSDVFNRWLRRHTVLAGDDVGRFVLIEVLAERRRKI